MAAGSTNSFSFTGFSHLLSLVHVDSLLSFCVDGVDGEEIVGEEIVAEETDGFVFILTEIPMIALSCGVSVTVDCFALLALSLDLVDLLVAGPGDCDKFLSVWDDMRSDWPLLVVLLVLWGEEEFKFAFFSAVWQSRQIRVPFEDFCHIRLDVALHFTQVGLRCDIVS